MAEADHLDDRGRITIRREYRERLGRRVIQILTPDGVLLYAVKGNLRFPKDFPAAIDASGEEEGVREALERARRRKASP